MSLSRTQIKERIYREAARARAQVVLALVLFGGAYAAGVAPAMHARATLRSHRAQVVQMTGLIASSEQRGVALQEDIGRLRQEVGLIDRDPPGRSDFTSDVAGVLQAAERSGLVVRETVIGDPVETEGDLRADVSLSSAGRPDDVRGFIGVLAEEYPYFGIRSMEIRRGREAGDGRADVQMTLVWRGRVASAGAVEGGS
ncbi:MAG: hypothetical protein AAGI17_06200 [Planctomycetota bacterium]